METLELEFSELMEIKRLVDLHKHERKTLCSLTTLAFKVCNKLNTLNEYKNLAEQINGEI